MGLLTSEIIEYVLRKTRQHLIKDNYIQLRVLFGSVFLQKGSLAHIQLKSERGVTRAVNGDRYRAMLENFLGPAVKSHLHIQFQHDGVTSHTVGATMALLGDIFGKRIIQLRSNLIRPSHTPYLTARGCFLRSYLKGKVYVIKSRTTD